MRLASLVPYNVYSKDKALNLVFERPATLTPADAATPAVAAAPLTAKQTPAEDSDFQFEGTPVSYTPKPFLMVMNEGKLLVKAAPAPAKKPAARRKPAAQ